MDLSRGEDLNWNDCQRHGALNVFDNLNLAFDGAMRDFSAQRLRHPRRDAADSSFHRVKKRIQLGGRNRVWFAVTAGVENKIQVEPAADGEPVDAGGDQLILLHL